jgi:hypothetical protein
MATIDVGDVYPIRLLVRDPDTQQLTDTTVALTVTDPVGVDTTPAPVHSGVGIYDYGILANAAGLWSWRWSGTGAIFLSETGSFAARDPAPPLYATLEELKSYLKPLDQTVRDDREAQDALEAVSRDIDSWCHRRFYPDRVATARIFAPISAELTQVDDFYTTTGLLIVTDDGYDDTYPTSWATSDVQLEPLNGVVDGIPGWPFDVLRVKAGRRFPLSDEWRMRATLRVTARWGWVATPAPVHEACKMLAAETLKAKDAPFGVAGFGQFGAVRVRDNPMAARKLRPYQRVESPV